MARTLKGCPGSIAQTLKAPACAERAFASATSSARVFVTPTSRELHLSLPLSRLRSSTERSLRELALLERPTMVSQSREETSSRPQTMWTVPESLRGGLWTRRTTSSSIAFGSTTITRGKGLDLCCWRAISKMPRRASAEGPPWSPAPIVSWQEVICSSEPVLSRWTAPLVAPYEPRFMSVMRMNAEHAGSTDRGRPRSPIQGSHGARLGEPCRSI